MKLKVINNAFGVECSACGEIIKDESIVYFDGKYLYHGTEECLSASCFEKSDLNELNKVVK